MNGELDGFKSVLNLECGFFGMIFIWRLVMKLFGGFENNFSLFCKIVIYCFSVFNIVCSKGEYIGNFEINNKYFDLYIFFG